jgi:hypothetical protein
MRTRGRKSRQFQADDTYGYPGSICHQTAT